MSRRVAAPALSFARQKDAQAACFAACVFLPLETNGLVRLRGQRPGTCQLPFLSRQAIP